MSRFVDVLKISAFWRSHKAKIVSAFAALFIWLLVVGGETFTYETEIPIEILHDKETVVLTPIQQKARVLLEGEGKFLFTFMLFRQGSLRLSLSPESGTHVVIPTEKDVFLTGSAQNLTLRRLLGPDSLTVQIDRMAVRELPIVSRATFKPAPGYTLVGRPQMTPTLVKVRAPQSRLRTLSAVETAEMVFEDLKFPVQKRVPLQMPAGMRAALSTTEVQFSVDVQKLMEKTISNVPVTVRYLPVDIDAFVVPSELSLVVEGGVDVVSPLKAGDIQAFIEYQPQMETTAEYSVNIEPIEGVRFRDVRPSRVKVILQHRRSE